MKEIAQLQKNVIAFADSRERPADVKHVKKAINGMIANGVDVKGLGRAFLSFIEVAGRSRVTMEQIVAAANDRLAETEASWKKHEAAVKEAEEQAKAAKKARAKKTIDQ